MQTHCPHCETHFRITKSQIDIADGFVRCGICEKVFNIYDVVDNTTLENDQQTLLSNDNNITENISDDINEDEDQYRTGYLDSEEEENNQTSQALSENEESETSDPEPLDNDDVFQKSSDDFFDEDSNESLQHVVPEELRSYKPASTTTTILWSTGILLLIASLAIEYIWFNRDDFNQFATLQKKIGQLCQSIQCEYQLQRAPEKIELITRNIYSHPNESDALMINLVIKNNAQYSQPYPVMQIEFSDIRGNSVAARRFFPIEYLATRYQHSETRQPHVMQADTSVNITLEIKDPGKNAMAYEFDFL